MWDVAGLFAEREVLRSVWTFSKDTSNLTCVPETLEPCIDVEVCIA